MSSLDLVLYIILVALNLADGITTWIFVHPDHYHREANPLARWIFGKLGITSGIILSELLWIGFISLLFFFVFPTLPYLATPLLSLGLLIWGILIPINIRYCLKLRAEGRLGKRRPDPKH